MFIIQLKYKLAVWLAPKFTYFKEWIVLKDMRLHRYITQERGDLDMPDDYNA